MDTVQDKTYETIYYSMWEAARRYSSFTQFRVIGKSHDDRMIPMLEIGQGDACIFCVAGFSGTDGQMTDRLTRMALELCRIYECNWTVDELYEVKKLLDQTRLCIIPVVNPDGYEICRKGYNTVRNPIFRQMLKMQDVPCDEFEGNARGMDTARNFPTTFCSRKKIHQQPASENETRALIRIFHWSEMLPSCTPLKKMYQGKAGAACNRTRSAERAKEHRQAGTVLRRNDPPAGFPDRIAGKFRK